MAFRTTTSLAIIFTFLSWTNASYVEAVAGAFNGSPAKANLQVAMSCGHFNKFLDPATRQWTDDLTSSCLEDNRDILIYCQKKYPGMDVTNIVEADQARNITAWCSEDSPEECTTTALVVPIRCLVGTFESDALIVPSRCRFRHLHEEGTCQSPQEWKRAAKTSCRKSKFKLASTGMLLPCTDQVDLFHGVEFVCCPRPGHEEQETAPTPNKSKPLKPKPAPVVPSDVDDEDPYFTEDETRDEGEAYELAKQRLSSRQQDRVATLMQQYQEAQKKFDPSNKKYASKKIEMSKRYEDAIAEMELETEQERARLQEIHETRIEGRLTTRIDTEEQIYWDTLNTVPLKSAKILRSFERYLKSVQKKRKHLISFYKHLRRVDPDKAAQKTDSILELLQASTDRVDENVDRLQMLPDVYAVIEASIAKLTATYSDTVDDVQFISGVQDEAIEIEEDESDDEEERNETNIGGEQEIEQPTVPLPTTVHQATTAARKPVTGPTVNEPDTAEQEEARTDYEDTELPTDFRSTLNTLEDETPVDHDIPSVAVKPIENYTSEERDVIPSKSMQHLVLAKKAQPQDSHSKTELHLRSKVKAYSMDKTVSKKALTSTPALAFALACAILSVMLGLVAAVLIMKKKSRRPQVNHNFSEVDPNLTVEQRHIVSMQQNGYENPTYKYFEMQ